MGVDDTEDMVGRAISGDVAAWTALFEVLLPGVERRVRGSRSFAGFRRNEDDVRNVVTTLFERLRRDDFRALRLYQSWRDGHDGKSFEDWLTIVTTNVIRDYVSDQLLTGADGVSKDSLHSSAAAEFDEQTQSGGRRRMGSATLTSVNQLAAAAAEKLSSEQLGVLDGWLQGYEFDELASRQQLDSGRDAEKLLRSALAKLRRHVDDVG